MSKFTMKTGKKGVCVGERKSERMVTGPRAVLKGSGGGSVGRGGGVKGIK